MILDVNAVSVMYHGRKVGTLSVAGRGICQFEYDKEWLANGFSISPLQLPLKAGLFTADYVPFGGNFGVFEDSLPGGYGEYLLLKVLRKAGIDYQSLSPVQRLSVIGSSGMGALCYVPERRSPLMLWSSSSDAWFSTCAPTISTTMPAISALSAAMVNGRWHLLTI